MFLLDTNVVSELRKAKSGKTDHNVISWAQSVSTNHIFISVITILEIEMGILQIERKDAKQGTILRTWMNDHVLPTFTNRTLEIDSAIAQTCAQLHVPDPRSDRDALIAATALVHNLTVVTRNTDDFINTGVMLINPWEN